MLLSSSTTSPLESLRPHLTESASVGLNSSVAYGLADTVSLYSSLKAHASSMFSTAGNPVPYSSNSWWTDEAMEALNYQFSSEELKILQDIASYRDQKGLPMPSVSKSLTAVAKIHAEDLFRNQPDHVGSCNLHSWSNKGFWTPVCYIVNPDGSHPYANLMWSKPKEITQKLFAQTFTGNGYEIAHSGDPANAVTSWKTSKGHNDVILEQDIWSNVDWNSIGVGVSNGHAVVWFAQESDPDDPGSNLNTAHKLGTLSGSRTFKESVGSSDPTDVYSFQVSKLSQVEVSIGGETISPSNTF
ncbi:MAG TPA: CAP domain-containing protein, partial [Allocoleopsis sp.]